MHPHLKVITVIALLAGVAPAARAGNMPPDIAEKVVALGRVIAVPQTDAIYAPLHPAGFGRGVQSIGSGPAEAAPRGTGPAGAWATHRRHRSTQSARRRVATACSRTVFSAGSAIRRSGAPYPM